MRKRNSVFYSDIENVHVGDNTRTLRPTRCPKQGPNGKQMVKKPSPKPKIPPITLVDNVEKKVKSNVLEKTVI